MTDRPLSHPFRVATLPTRKPQRFALAPDAPTLAAVAEDLGITAVSAMRFEGEIRAHGRNDFFMEARLTATVTQPCVISLEPVVTKIDAEVRRHYTADFKIADNDEAEIPDDDTLEPLGEVIDAGEVAVEELSLALPPYPRAKDAELGEAVFAEPGSAPLKDEDLKPFAGLASLKDKLGKPE